jgi:hypothetical protein
MVLGIGFYLLMRGGFMKAGANVQESVEPYAYATVALLAGLFSVQAMERLRKIAAGFFDGTDPYTDPLKGKHLQISHADVALDAAGKPQALRLTGSGFEAKSKVYFDQTVQTATLGTDGTLSVVVPAMWASTPPTTPINIRVVNSDNVSSDPLYFNVADGITAAQDQAKASGRPHIASAVVVLGDGDALKTLRLVGSGFVAQSQVYADQTPLKATLGTDGALLANPLSEWSAALPPTPVNLFVINPGNLSSNPLRYDLQNEVKAAKQQAIAARKPTITAAVAVLDQNKKITSVRLTGANYTDTSKVKFGDELQNAKLTGADLMVMAPAAWANSPAGLTLAITVVNTSGGASDAHAFDVSKAIMAAS